MSRARVRSVDGVPRARAQRTPPPDSVPAVWPHGGEWQRIKQAADDAARPAPPRDERPGRYLPGQLGRFPTVGLDEGAIKNTRPDKSRIVT